MQIYNDNLLYKEENNKPIINYNPNFIHYGSNAVNASTQN